MYEIGMYGGTFNPLHLGHVNDIIMAKNQCKKLYIPISISDDPKEIDEKNQNHVAKKYYSRYGKCRSIPNLFKELK